MSIADVGQRTENSFALRDSLWRVFALNVGKTQLTEKRHRGRRQQTEVRPLYPQSHCMPPERETAGTGDNTTAQATVQSPLNLFVVSPVFLRPLCSRIPGK